MIEQLQKNKRVAITASTGMSRLQFHNGDTLHHWSGYGDGHLDTQTIIGRILFNPAYKTLKENINNTEILIIDEIGLISEKMLKSVEEICRAIKDNNQVFGGLQVVAAGSFTQLPPVASNVDPGKYSFECQNFHKMLPHKLQLNSVFRQKEPDLVQAVNELCMGNPSAETIKLLKSLGRPLPSTIKPVFIFGTNFDVSYYNMEQLQQLPGPLHTCKSIDDGDRKYLKRCTAPHLLPLKLNCKVIVLRNLENGLVNGLSGVVTHIEDDTVTIKVEEDPHMSHKMGGQTFHLQRYKFVLRDEQNHVCAIRNQFPLTLGYALTVHKAQGRSIPQLVVDCYNFWKPAQMGVAIGRATSKEGLQVQNYNSYAANLKHPQCVSDFYECRGEAFKGSLECCKSTISDAKLLYTEQSLRYTTAADEDLTDMDFRNRNSRKFPYNLDTFLEENKVPEYSDQQKARNALLENSLTRKEFVGFLTYLYNKVVYFVEHYKIPPKGVKCNWCAMVAHIYKFLISSQHLQQCKKAFSTETLTVVQNSLCTELFHVLLTKYTTRKKNISQGQNKLDPSTFSNELKCTIRYIAGASLNSVAQKLKASVNNKLLHRFEEAKSGFRAVQILNTLRVPEAVLLEESCEPESLLEIVRRQGKTQGLTHVSDDCFKFFCKLYSEVDCLQNVQSIVSDPKNANSAAIQSLLENSELLQDWMSLFADQSSPCDCIDESASEDESEMSNEMMVDEVLQFEVEQLLVTDMYEMAVQYFCRAHMSDVVSQYKFKIGKKKESSLRSSLGNVMSKKDALGIDVQFPCGVCEKACIDTEMSPEADFSESSVGCDGCEKWFHFHCVGLTGTESFLKPSSKLKYYCPNCQEFPTHKRKNPHTPKGKGIGKKSKTSDESRTASIPDSRTRSGRVRKAPTKLNL